MNQISAVIFKMLCGQKSYYKKLPEFIYHVSDEYKLLLLKYAILGDGHKRENDKRYSKAYKKKNTPEGILQIYNMHKMQIIVKNLLYYKIYRKIKFILYFALVHRHSQFLPQLFFCTAFP